MRASLPFASSPEHCLPRIQFLFIGSRLCSTLLSDLTSRLGPCASLSLHLHLVVKRTCTSKLSIMLGTQMQKGRALCGPFALIGIRDEIFLVVTIWEELFHGLPGRRVQNQLSCVGMIVVSEVAVPQAVKIKQSVERTGNRVRRAIANPAQ